MDEGEEIFISLVNCVTIGKEFLSKVILFFNKALKVKNANIYINKGFKDN